MDHQAVDFKNDITIRVLSGETGKVLDEAHAHNDISDDLLAWCRVIYGNGYANASGAGCPCCFFLPDGPLWNGFIWDRSNPWAPYCYSMNNLYQGEVDATAEPHWANHKWNWDGSRHRLWFRWTKLADDVQLKALGLTAWNPWVDQWAQGYGVVNGQPTVFIPQTLVVLPSSILVRGRKNGTQIPDTLEISYYLSIVGVN